MNHSIINLDEKWNEIPKHLAKCLFRMWNHYAKLYLVFIGNAIHHRILFRKALCSHNAKYANRPCECCPNLSEMKLLIRDRYKEKKINMSVIRSDHNQRIVHCFQYSCLNVFTREQTKKMMSEKKKIITNETKSIVDSGAWNQLTTAQNHLKLCKQRRAQTKKQHDSMIFPLPYERSDSV